MFPLLRVGPFLVQIPGLALLAGLWIAVTLIEKESLHLKLNATALQNTIFYSLISGLFGARLIYAVQHLNIYLPNPLSFLSLNTSTLNPLGGTIIGTVAIYLFGHRQRMPLRPTLDALTPGLAVIMIATDIANIFSGNSYGSSTRSPWAIYLWGEYRHPTQIYETAAALIIFILWKAGSKTPDETGISFLQVVALSVGARIFLEAFHGDSLIWPGGFRAAQVIGLIVIAITIYLTKQWRKAEIK